MWFCYFRVDSYRTFQNVSFPIFFYIPTIGVVTICGVLITLVRIRSKKIPASRKQEKEQRKEKQAVLQLSLIICGFLIGYIPFTSILSNIFIVAVAINSFKKAFIKLFRPAGDVEERDLYGL